MAKEGITEAEAAYSKAQSTIAELRAEYHSTSAEIKVAEAALKSLTLAPLPLEDLKAGILDFVGASGARYMDSVIRRNISQFAKGGRSDAEGRKGRPLRFCDIEGAVSGESPVLASERLFQERLDEFNDQMLGVFFAEAAKDALRRVMADMHPNEFGYDKVEPHEIGTDRATRRQAIEEAKIRLAELEAQREKLTRQLCGLGFTITGGDIK